MIQVYKSSGIIDPKLSNQMEIPYYSKYLWDWFWELRNSIGGTGFGPSPIGYSDIMAWSFLLDKKIQPWEIDIIRRLDTEFIRFSSEKTRNEFNKK